VKLELLPIGPRVTAPGENNIAAGLELCYKIPAFKSLQREGVRMRGDGKKFLSDIASKVAVLMGGAVAATSVNALASAPVLPPSNTNTVSAPSASTLRSLAPKLILKQQKDGFKMIASHDSHSSHSSHSSHASHSSHSSSAY
jgi:hypothetical protein